MNKQKHEKKQLIENVTYLRSQTLLVFKEEGIAETNLAKRF